MSTVKIVHGSVYGPNYKFEDRTIVIKNGLFIEEKLSAAQGSPSEPKDDCEIIDASGCWVIPGMIDIHFHGAMGSDVCDGTRKAFQTIAHYELLQGITAICPATLTLPVEKLEHIVSVGASFADEQRSAKKRRDPDPQILSGLDPMHSRKTANDISYPHNIPAADLIGFNMEGPFISREKKGAQNEDYILPCDTAVVSRFLSASQGLVKIICLAPEENPGFEEYIRSVKENIIVSLGHTNTSYDDAVKAFRAGASHTVHFFNAMTGLHHREPGLAGAVSDIIAERIAGNSQQERDIFVEIICDGRHVHPAAVRAAFRLIGAEHMVFISDSLRSAGMPDREYVLGGLPVIKNGNACYLKSSGLLAGSVTHLADCLRIAVREMGIPLEVAVRCATINPARAIGEDRCYGSIEPGKHGNVVLLKKDEALSLTAVIKDGQVIRI